jgi:ATP-binding cassette, subfamily F, member 3
VQAPRCRRQPGRPGRQQRGRQVDADAGRGGKARARRRAGRAAQGTPRSAISRRSAGRFQFSVRHVLAADVERTRLLSAEQSTTRSRSPKTHERLNAIDAHAAPVARRKILAGLGFDEDMQAGRSRQLLGRLADARRSCCAAVLAPDLLLLDEPSNHLDLEATLWLEDFLAATRCDDADRQPRARPAQQRGRSHPSSGAGPDDALYRGGYDAFERQRLERQAQRRRRGRSSSPSAPSCRRSSIAGAPRRIPPARPRAG